MSTVVEKQQHIQPEGSGPMAEIEFWRNRNAVLSSLHEQIHLPRVETMVRVLELSGSNSLQNFKFNLQGAPVFPHYWLCWHIHARDICAFFPLL